MDKVVPITEDSTDSKSHPPLTAKDLHVPDASATTTGTAESAGGAPAPSSPKGGFTSPPVPSNMFKFATERSETPKELLARTLGNGETVTGSFEVYFQSDRLSVAEWWFKVITTCGMFLLSKLWKRFMDWLCCRRVKEIHYERHHGDDLCRTNHLVEPQLRSIPRGSPGSQRHTAGHGPSVQD